MMKLILAAVAGSVAMTLYLQYRAASYLPGVNL